MDELTPFETLQQIAAGHCLPRCLHVVAEIGVADALDEAPQTAAALAAASGTNADALARALRLLSAYGVFETDGELFRHSPASRLLRSDHPQSMRAFVRMLGLPVFWATFGAMEHSLRTGAAATEKTLPDGLWAYFAQHPQAATIFNEAMTAKAHGQVAGVAAAYDFSTCERIGDIGGGRGHLSQAVLQAAPRSRAVLFDLPHVINEARAAATDRLELQAGDFFKDPLPVCDAYILMEVIHDWNDEDSVAILSAVRRAAPVHARLLVIETLVPDDPRPHWAKLLDILMLTLLSGRQRTRDEYQRLLAASGWRLTRLIDVPGGVSILEAAVA